MTSKASDVEWVPLAEGWRIIGRHLSGEATDSFSDDVGHKAAGMLKAAAREGRIKSEGWRDQGAERESLTKEDWQKRRIDVVRNRLLEMVPWTRRIPHPDRIIEIVVDANDVQQLLTLPAAVVRPSSEPADSDGAKEMAVLDAVTDLWPAGIPRHLPASERDRLIIKWCADCGVSSISVRHIQRVLAKRQKATSDDK